ncbi:MAG: cbb3-type cytochrome c oxidase subunit I [Halobacteriales archaeon]|nr:cbb3-type cytochrome c oxidase subunit I [Halobacteriales archaeon]
MAEHGHGEHAQMTGWRRWAYSTNHQEIGLMYIWTAFFFFIIGGMLAMLMRVELMAPGPTIMDPQAFNELFTMHGTTMVFLWIMPVFAGFGNYFVPLMIGAKDMAFPRINALSFWLIPPAGAMLFLAAFLPGQHLADAGWTGYVPLSLQSPGLGMSFWFLGLHLLGVASTLGALNFIVTIFRMRAPGVTFHNMPLFVWAQLTTAFLLLFSLPVLGTALVMGFGDRTLGTHYYDLASGGAILWQHLFWFFAHPEVYVLILPSMGIVSEVLPKFTGRPIFGYKAMAYSILGIGFLGYTVWVHHMFVTGIPSSVRTVFMINTMIIGVPTGVKIFNWLATIWGGRIQLKTPMLFALAFIGNFLIGGLDGIFLASIPVDYQLTDTYWVVSHIHYVLFGGAVLGIFAGVYYWFPRMTGRMYNEKLGVAHFVLTVIFLNVTFFIQHSLGLAGMPRRVADYIPAFTQMNLISSIGAVCLGLTQLLFLYNALVSLRSGRIVGSGDPWGGSVRPEWQHGIMPNPVAHASAEPHAEVRHGGEL